MRRDLLALAVLVGLLLAPAAMASHTMGHRYLVYGRIIDAAGMPVQNSNVELRIERSNGVAFAGIVTKTDCMGDFRNWEGQPGPVPVGGGQGQEPGLEQNHFPNGTAYIAFHIHDAELSNSYKVHVFVEGQNWTEAFHSEVRQTSVRHQISKTLAPRCGDFDQFNSTFVSRVSILSAEEMRTGDIVPKTRHVVATLSNGHVVNGTTDFNGAFVATFLNATLPAGGTLKIQADDINDRTLHLDANAVKFRRADSVNVAGQNVGGAINDFKYVGILLLIVAIGIGLWWASSRLRARREEARLRQSSNRRRFRREGGPPPAP